MMILFFTLILKKAVMHYMTVQMNRHDIISKSANRFSYFAEWNGLFEKVKKKMKHMHQVARRTALQRVQR